MADALQIGWVWMSPRNEPRRNRGPGGRRCRAAVPPHAFGIDISQYRGTSRDQLLTVRRPTKTLCGASVDLPFGAEYRAVRQLGWSRFVRRVQILLASALWRLDYKSPTVSPSHASRSTFAVDIGQLPPAVDRVWATVQATDWAHACACDRLSAMDRRRYDPDSHGRDSRSPAAVSGTVPTSAGSHRRR